MLEFYIVLDTPPDTWDTSISLPVDKRIKSRLKVTLNNGQQAGLFLPRGGIVRHGQCVESTCGVVLQIQSAPEPVSSVYEDNTFLLMRIAYHLGNRHVPLEIGMGFVRYQPDHVRDEMVEKLGGTITHENMPFEPEAGAYHPHGH